jgi:hypothetical protein
MRHLFLISAFMILGGASAAGAAPAGVVQTPSAKTTSTGERCQRAGVIWAERGKSAQRSKLGELPPGDLVLTVVREENGCQKPVIVRYGIGSNPVPAPRPRRPVRP